MQTIDTVEGNKLIAEFDGAYLRTVVMNGIVQTPLFWDINNSKHPLAAARFSEEDVLQYHTSWDWLMPVVEKIAKLKIKYSNDSDYYSPYPRTFGMQDEQGNFMVRLNVSQLFTDPSFIKAVWLAVVDFIEWCKSIKA